MAARDDSARAARHDDEVRVKVLTDQVSFLEEELAALRSKIADSPRTSRLLEERLAQTEASLAGLTGQNERLTATLREARDQIIALKEEVDRLAQPPSGFRGFLQANADGGGGQGRRFPCGRGPGRLRLTAQTPSRGWRNPSWGKGPISPPARSGVPARRSSKSGMQLSCPTCTPPYSRNTSCARRRACCCT